MATKLCPLLGSHHVQFILIIEKCIASFDSVSVYTNCVEVKTTCSVSLVLLELKGAAMVFEHFRAKV